MNVFNHLLPDDFVVGIGPLHLVDEGLKYHYYFHLVLSTHTMLIHSDVWDKSFTEHTKEMKAWVRQYMVYRHQIIKRLGETDPTYTTHVEQVGNVYEAAKDKLNNLFADLVPGPFNQEPVNERISAVFSALQHLRDLACK